MPDRNAPSRLSPPMPMFPSAFYYSECYAEPPPDAASWHLPPVVLPDSLARQQDFIPPSSTLYNNCCAYSAGMPSGYTYQPGQGALHAYDAAGAYSHSVSYSHGPYDPSIPSLFYSDGSKLRRIDRAAYFSDRAPEPIKRKRRRPEQIDRIYVCGYNGCQKGYGSLNHLNTHIVNHNHGPKRKSADFQDIKNRKKKNSVSSESSYSSPESSS
ncbi:hypothetical protein TRVA0_005S02520 [Trichomonascus vanleenenianus]|uniref:uncharacterized protein n=1 Tax=Trichomonascus vanleenenianus TaxID=2268995 RepID=UPI003ECA44EB